MFNYPKTRQQIVTDTLHGRAVDDPYRWLEASNSDEVAAWSAAQNRFTQETIRAGRDPQEFKRELTGLFAVDSFSLPTERCGWYYWSERKAGENQLSLYRRHGLDGQPELMLDANALSDDGTVTIARWNLSPTGRYLTYALSEKGAESGKLYVRDLSSSNLAPLDEIPDVRYPSLVWTADESSFYYTRHPVPGTVDVGDEQYFERLYRHALGEKWQTDQLIFGDGRHKEDYMSLDYSTDRRYLIISVRRDWAKNEIYVLDTTTSALRPVVKNINSRFSLSIIHGRPYLYTNFEAEFGRLLTFDSLDFPADITDWRELIPERTGQKFGSCEFTSEIMLVERLIEGESRVEVYDHDGTYLRALELPPQVSLTGLRCQEDRAEYFYEVTSYLEPAVQYRCQDASSTAVIYRKIEIDADMSPYTVAKAYATSSDGTRIPVALVHARDLVRDGTNPTLLNGYGGFGTVKSPSFIRGLVPFLKRGGMYAVAMIRGGGEGGSAWHRAGVGEHKQTSFSDFTAAAEMLIQQGYTSPAKLAILGGSNGGLLVGACAVARPELFKAVICRVPLLDMVRYPQFLIASRWVSEYGDPTIKADFERILKWSPYHNVAPDGVYPAWLIMTADHDTRVEPLHARKMAALLQSRGDINPVLIRTEMDAGHGAGTPVSKWVDAQADMLAFLAWQLHMTI